MSVVGSMRFSVELHARVDPKKIDVKVVTLDVTRRFFFFVSSVRFLAVLLPCSLPLFSRSTRHVYL